MFRLVGAAHGAVHLVEVDGISHRVTRDEGGVLRSPAPALVVAIPVEVGATVAAGAPVLVLESMKMETVIPAPFAARVRELMVATGGQVETGMPMVRLEPLSDDESGTTAEADAAGAGPSSTCPRQPRPSARLPALRRCSRTCAACCSASTSPPATGPQTLAEYQRLRADALAADPSLLRTELDVVTVFADLAELIRNRPAGEETSDVRVHSPREYFHSYLHSLDVDRERLPDAFRTRLARVLAHYGVPDLDRSPALEEAVYRIFLAQQRTAADLAVVTSVLQHWLTDEPPEHDLGQQTHDVLDRLVVATQLRFPIVGELARSARFRWFDQPVTEAVRADALAGVPAELDYLISHPDAPDYAERLEAVAAIPEQVVRFLAERLERGIPEREPMLEVLARRHYREHELHDLRSFSRGGPAVRHLRLHARRPPDPAGDHGRAAGGARRVGRPAWPRHHPR